MYFVGLDVGTTGAKVVVVDERGEVRGKGYRGYGLITDGPKIEQRADDWTQAGAYAVRRALEGLDSREVAAVSTSTQGSSCVAIDGAGRPLANAYTWMDSRSEREAALLEKRLGGDYFYKNTGWRLCSVLDAPKIMNMKNMPSLSGAVKFYSTIEYVNLFLTGNAVIDPTNASIRLMYNIREDKWDADILSAAGIREDELARVIPAGAAVGGVTEDAARLTGLVPGTPVFNGAHDQYCASIGCGAVRAGDMLLSAGTAWVVMGIVGEPLFTDTCIAAAKHPVPGLYGAMASLAGAGSAMQWFKEGFTSESFAVIDETARVRGKNTRTLFFYPYMYGPTYPLWLRNGTAAFTGIAPEHDRFDFARAVMESSAFGVRRALDDFAANGCELKRLKIMGGAAKSDFWCSLITDCAELPTRVMREPDACAVGAAAIAAVGVGAFSDYARAADVFSSGSNELLPDGARADALREKRREYEAALGRLN